MVGFERRKGLMGVLLAMIAFSLGGCIHRDSYAYAPDVYRSLKDSPTTARPVRRAAVQRASAATDAPRVLPPLRQQAAAQSIPAPPPSPRMAAPSVATPVSASPPPAAPAAPPPQAAPSAPAIMDAAAVERLLSEGQSLFESGKVLDARRRFITAMNGPVPEVLLALARSYDTYYLSRLPAADAAPDMQRALVLYERAAERGAIEANADLERTRAILKIPR